MLSRRVYPLLLGFVSLLSYVCGFGQIQIPKIGDEVLYLQIARVTGASGHWLPLRDEEGILSTKPPLLYWLGIASSKIFGESLWAYRLPVLLVTFLSAIVVYLISQRLLKKKEDSLWAAAVYLGFISTFQHGRPFLVNSFEVLFLLLPLYFFLKKPALTKTHWLLCALSWGAVAWSKSFALIGVGFFATFWSMQFVLPTAGKKKLIERVLYFGSAAFVALLIFALWSFNLLVNQ